jgi:predicted phosphodiesterase
MYNATTQRELLVEIAENFRDPSTKLISWVTASKKLNTTFKESVGRKVWKRRYQRAIAFMEKLETNTFKGVSHKNYINKGEPLKVDSIKDKIITLLKGGSRSILELSGRVDLDKYATMGILEEIANDGIYQIKKMTEQDGTLRYAIDTLVQQERKEYEHAVGTTNVHTFMVLSDSHMGSMNEQTSFLHYLYDYAQQRGITTVYHCGDISEGWKRSRPDHQFSLHAISFDEQLEHIVKHYPKRDGIMTYFITGNHDHFHIQNGGANIGKGIESQRSDMKYLGINTAVIKLGEHAKMELFHPQDGSSYALSYGGQKYLDSLNGGDKPNIIFVGHHHKSLYFLYRNVHYFEVPSTHSQSDWEKGKRIQNTSGAWIVTVEVDSEGTVTRIVPESIIQFKHIKDDWKQWKELTK